MSSKGFHWYNNGLQEVNAKECPNGWVQGRLKLSEETRKKMSASSWIKKASKEELAQRNNKISSTIQSRTSEEKEEYSLKISASRKGKGLGHSPWNKGKHVDIWNKGVPMLEEQKQKLRDYYNSLPQEEKERRIQILTNSHKGKSSWNKGLTYTLDKEVVARMKAKENLTKKLNGTYTTSKLEENVYLELISIFGIDNVKRQYRDARYEFSCDFYIIPLDLFIEVNGNWTHGTHPYLFEEEDQVLLEKWKTKESKYYENAIYTWSDLDVRKRDMAIKNHLNYITIYPQESLDSNLEYCLNNNLDSEDFISILYLIYNTCM